MEKDIELLSILLWILAIGSIFELGLLGFAYYNADEVDCNLLWCEFKSSDVIRTERTCWINKYEVNCSELDNNYNIIDTDGNFDIKPILKEDKEWIDIINFQKS